MAEPKPLRGGRRVHKMYVVGGFAFVPHPEYHGMWLRTDLSVAKVACTFPGCGSEIGVPCKRLRYVKRGADYVHESTGYSSATHWTRRKDAGRASLPTNIDEMQITIRKP